jgi:hypothetical protein
VVEGEGFATSSREYGHNENAGCTGEDAVEGGDGMKLEQVQVLDPWSLKSIPENDEVYAKLTVDAPEMRDLIASVRKNRVMEPIRVTSDGYIVSGHRRRFAALATGVPSVHPIMLDVSYRRDRDKGQGLEAAGRIQWAAHVPRGATVSSFC